MPTLHPADSSHLPTMVAPGGGDLDPTTMNSAASSGRSRRPSGGGKGRGGGRLGLKTKVLTSTSHPSASTTSLPHSPSVPSPPPATSPAVPSPPEAVPSSSPTVLCSSAPPWPLQGAEWCTMPPIFPSEHGNQHGTNSGIYPPGGFLNMIQQPQVQGENFHLDGQTMTFDQISPPPPTSSAYRTGASKILFRWCNMHRQSDPAVLNVWGAKKNRSRVQG